MKVGVIRINKKNEILKYSLLVHTKICSMPTQLMQAAGCSEITVNKNGYLFVFVSNASEGAVYFDDLSACPGPVERVTHMPGPLKVACPDKGGNYHYYPTGLEMFALRSSATNGHACPDKGGVSNRYGYQGQEHENTFALNLNEFEA